MKHQVTIYVMTHKDVPQPSEPGYTLLHVGAALHQYTFNAVSDAVGNSISEKNPNYCELTGLYWVWKNDDISDIVGFIHYRRHFERGWLSNKWLSINQIEKLLKKHDAIVPNSLYLTHGYTVRTQYLANHHKQDLSVARDVISRKYPDYLSAFDQLMNQKKLYPYNMCVMKRDMFDSYAEWLFNILFAIEEEIDISAYDSYNKRIFGFLSERLFNVWIQKNNISVVEKPVINTDQNRKDQIWSNFKSFVRYHLEKK